MIPDEAAGYSSQSDCAGFGNYGTQQVKQLQDQGADIGYVLPEGGAAWMDCWTTIVRAPQIARWLKSWINHTLEASVSNVLEQASGPAQYRDRNQTTSRDDKPSGATGRGCRARRACSSGSIRSGRRWENF